MLIFIDEEYGWRYHRWDYPGTPEELCADWLAGRIPPNLGYVRPAPGWRGSVGTVEPLQEQMDRQMSETEGMTGDEAIAHLEANASRIENELVEGWQAYLADFGAVVRIHQEDDSFLEIGERVVPWLFRPDDDGVAADRMVNPLPKERP